MKTILAATAFLEAVGKALLFAAKLARHFNTKLVLFHIRL